MCTLTLFGVANGGFRLAFNRDESRARPAALPPAPRKCGARHALMPVDPQGGGTWIAVNDAGLAAALLNLHQPSSARPAAGGWSTRGGIVPLLMECGDAETAGRAALSLDARRYRPFRLCLAGGARALEIRSDGEVISVSARRAIGSPVMMTSSGLGDDLVEAPRRALFEESVRRGGDPRRLQDSFHRHSWPDRPHLSVCMRRPEAATVSHAIVEVDRSGGQAAMLYHAGPPDEQAPRTRVRLGLP